jgi:hypothetical protein
MMKELVKSSLRTFAWIRVLLLFAAIGFIYLIITSTQQRELLGGLNVFQTATASRPVRSVSIAYIPFSKMPPHV